MTASLSTLVAVLGTSLGFVVTHLFQRNSAEQMRIFTAHQHLRSERLAVHSDFTGAVTDLRGASTIAGKGAAKIPKAQPASRPAPSPTASVAGLCTPCSASSSW